MEKRSSDNNINEIVKKYAALLYRTAYLYTKNGSDAEEIVQEVYIKYFKKAPKFDSEEHEKAWLLRVAINLSKDYLKSTWNKKTQKLDVEGIYNMDDSWMVIEMIKSLPEKYRVVIQLFYIEGYSTAEVARILNKNESTIRTQLSRAKEMLKKMEV